jgi:Zn-dependent protease with chaperone function
LELCQWQRDEVAFVLGHEMAHIVRRHTLDRIVKDAALSLLLRHSSVQQAASAWLGQSGRQVLSRAFSHDDELEADAFAVALIRSAGGDPLAGEHLLEKLARLFSSQGLSAYYFTSHPSLAERLANLRASGQSPVTSRQ